MSPPHTAPASAVPSNYFFVPYLGVQQQPKAPFTWTTNLAQNCTAEGTKCLGYDSNNNVFDSGIMQPQGARLSFLPDPTKGSYFNDKNKFAVICSQHLGGQLTTDRTKCQLTAGQAESAVRRSISGFDGTIGNANSLPNAIIVIGLISLIVYGMRHLRRML